MLCGKGYLQMQRILSDPALKFAGILFSGGGNDIIGRTLLALLNQSAEGMTWMDSINLVRFDRRLQQIENAYHELADLRDDYQPEAYIFTHAYDFPIPGNKPWRIGRAGEGGAVDHTSYGQKVHHQRRQPKGNHDLHVEAAG